MLRDKIGQQEYSARQAGLTFGIILAVIVPIIIILVYAGYLILKRMRESKDDTSYLSPIRASSRLKIEDDSRAISPVTPTSDQTYTYTSPVSDRSSSDSTKKRRSYDKTYRTHEPLKGLPEVEFEEKQWDLDEAPSPTSEYGSDSKPVYVEPQTDAVDSPTNEYSVPFDSGNKRHTYMQPDVQANKPDGARSASNPNLLDNRYTLPDYAVVNKDRNRDRVQSQSSIITDV